MQINNKKLSKGNNTYYEKLLEKLGKIKDWEYAGKKEDCFSKSMKEHYSFVWPPHSSKCACGHVITKNCHIRNLNTNEIKVVGNCCIKKWNIEKKCIKCNETHHRRDYIICGSCEKEECEEKKREKKLLKIGNKIISFGKHKNKTIKFIYENDIGYARWCFYEFDIDDNSTLKFRDISYYYEHMSDDDDDDEAEDEDEESEEEKLLRIGNKIISFGKHINKTIKFIYENDIGYAKWCFYKTDRSNNMKYICYYYKKMMNIDD